MIAPLPPQPKILVLFAHPYPHASRVNVAMRRAIADLPHVRVHDLYDLYPEFDIDVEHEQAALLEHDVIVLQHPLYWYSCPALLKEWIDSVLRYGWAYGPGGGSLQGKELVQVVSASSAADGYGPEGFDGHDLPALLLPFTRTAQLCGMTYRAPLFFDDANTRSSDEVMAHAAAYRNWLRDYARPNIAASSDGGV
ncbi:NAD(P)H-dependent oxidoreductase [Ferrovibrio sp.]|uniref:NAD(P)H-dependent oxidoreductase n=1 Tax=Ferrovibrio sp. TaxID=1917215 RepID=UPI0025C4996B|nr:NAD(P)H-dependent oxidoreductase [Ferrovibrio sp.]MBX3453949.1 NAD(P)H-dependent oxidoreductase [Ferrovibrio sp.]